MLRRFFGQDNERGGVPRFRQEQSLSLRVARWVAAGFNMQVPSPLVTVLLPFYNAVPGLERAIESIRSQRFQGWELLLVDDGSNDGSSSIAQRLATQDTRIRCLTRPHEGIVSALNAGLSCARAPLIARMDADDEALPGRLGAQAALLEQHPEIGVVGSLVQFGGDPVRAKGYAMHVDWINSIVTTEEIILNQFVESPFAHPSVMFRRVLVNTHGGYGYGEFPEDYELWLRWLSAGVRMTKIQAVLLTWHDGADRLSRRDPRYSADAFYRCKSRYLARWLEANVDRTRRIMVWGAGRLTRRRAGHLQCQGVEFGGYIDIDPRKWGRRFAGAAVINPGLLPTPASCFVLGYVGKRGARELIRAKLQSQGFNEGRDFLMVA